MSLTIQSGGSITLQGGSGGGGAISAVESATKAGAVNFSSTTFTNASPAISITATTGTHVLVTISANLTGTTASGTGFVGLDISGATSNPAASNSYNIAFSPSTAYYSASCSGTWKVPVNAGSNVFRLQFKSDNGSQKIAYDPTIVVQTLA